LDGSISSDSTWWLTDYFIKVPSNKIMSISDGSYRVAVYDENYVFNTRRNATGNVIDLTAYADPSYIKISGAVTPETVMLNNGGSLKNHVPFKKVIEKRHIPETEFADVKNVKISPEHEVHFRSSKNLYNRFN